MGTVIPAKAGIHSASHWEYSADGLDSRSPAFAEDKLRGNDWSIERDPIPNDTTTSRPKALTLFRRLCYGQMLMLAVIFSVHTKEALRVWPEATSSFYL
jgi:hypothetical protein